MTKSLKSTYCGMGRKGEVIEVFLSRSCILNPSLLHFTGVNINKGKPPGPAGIDFQVKELRPGDMLLGVPTDRALNAFERL